MSVCDLGRSIHNFSVNLHLIIHEVRPVGAYALKCELHPLVGKSSTGRIMSSYFQVLDKSSKKRYQQKPELARISLKDDPYSPDRSGEWSSDVRYWPKIEYGDIFLYFISRPGTFTLQQLTSRRQLEAYNYFKNNHVRTVLSSTCDAGRCVVQKSKVHPS